MNISIICLLPVFVEPTFSCLPSAKPESTCPHCPTFMIIFQSTHSLSSYNKNHKGFACILCDLFSSLERKQYSSWLLFVSISVWKFVTACEFPHNKININFCVLEYIVSTVRFPWFPQIENLTGFWLIKAETDSHIDLITFRFFFFYIFCSTMSSIISPDF